MHTSRYSDEDSEKKYEETREDFAKDESPLRIGIAPDRRRTILTAAGETDLRAGPAFIARNFSYCCKDQTYSSGLSCRVLLNVQKISGECPAAAGRYP